jgi:ubiquinone/menaquinone biosynthesis C-methylase UbiE
MIHPVIEKKLQSKEEIHIELGCGNQKPEGKIGIDIVPLDGVDIVANIEEGLAFIPDSTVDSISSRHFLEHVQNYELLIKEIHRILKSNGIHRAIVPYFSNPHYYSDYTHKKFFGIYSFDYFASEESKLKRKVPSFYNDIRFHIIKRELNFKSRNPIRHKYRKLIGKIFNSSNKMKEWYEESFAYKIPCSEILFEMKALKK